ncbi:SusE domain-containing protein [Pedobacter sp. MC2016-14]|uniref:SusE domain-containing protein n=1 Tax=Pedobacter sp. MC2016-14 TaxID=2897327 RepID=UPI001E405EE3|nr:SusE domain-containing protein [Pedobacter sp. MC2016-14]MCD0488248.1 SusE domain-containing protein [Pedobacter sp. MC2016-14]
MKQLFNSFLVLVLSAIVLISCKKEASQNIITMPSASTLDFKSSVSAVTLTEEVAASKVVTFSFSAPNYGVKVVPSYTLQFDVPADTLGANPWGNAVEVKLSGDSLHRTFLGSQLNTILAAQLLLPTGVNSTIVVRLKTDVNQSTGLSTTVKPLYSTIKMTVNPYRSYIEYPALLVQGRNSWKTPATRTNGYLLASSNFNTKYEGFLNLPNADGWGGDAFQLVSTTDAKVYGWGSSATTLSAGGGNLWLSPAPNYMKVNVDLNAMTIAYTPVKFFITGEDNGWSVSSTPMVYNATTGVWIASNVTLTAGKTFQFTANGSYDISYKLDKAENGTLIFAGAPNWPTSVNIPVAKTGVFTVTLDMSGGEGNYTYSVK